MSDVKTNEGVPALALDLDLDVGMEEGRRGPGAAAAGCLEDPLMKAVREHLGEPAGLTGEERARAHRHVAVWRGRELEPWSMEREILYRELRVKMGAPRMDRIEALYDFLPEAVRVLFIASYSKEALKKWRRLPVEVQVAVVEDWGATLGLEEVEGACEVAQEILQAVGRMRSGVLETEGGEEVDGAGE